MALSIGELTAAFLFSLLSLLTALVSLLVIIPCEAIAFVFRCGGSKRSKPTSIAITGATSGVGEALAVAYAAPGIHLALSGRNAAALAAVEKACTAKGAKVITRTFDVGSDSAATQAWLAAADAAAPVQLVIANAGITENTANLTSVDQLEAAARAVFQTNITGVVNTIFPLLTAMRSRGKGQIAIVSSLASFMPMGGSAAYSASKAAVRMYGEGLRLVLRRDGINVNVICPGYIESPMTAVQKFPMPGIVSMAAAIPIIIDGLERNVNVIDFPSSMAVLTEAIGSLHWVVRDFLGRHRLVTQVAYFKTSKKGGAHAAAAAAAPVSESGKASSSGGGSRGKSSARKEL